MNLIADVSLNTLIITAVVGLVGWGLKGVAWALMETCKTLIVTLTRTILKVEGLEKQIHQLVEAVGDIQRIRSDLNGFYARLKRCEDKLDLQ